MHWRKQLKVRSVIVMCLASMVIFYFSAAQAEPILQEISHSVGEKHRRYSIHNVSTKSRPLVVVLHGWRRSGQAIRGKGKLDEDLFAGLDNLAITEEFTTVYPVAMNGVWNLTAGLKSKAWGNAEPPDDVAFISSLIMRLIDEKVADSKRIYLTGFSNGAIMSYRLLCTIGDTFAAAAPISGTMSVTTRDNCNTGILPPLFAMMGTEDPILPYDGWLDPLGGELSIPEVFRLWSEQFGCKGQTAKALQSSQASLSRVRSISWTDCNAGKAKALKLFRIEGGGHRVATFKRGAKRWDKRFGTQNTDIDASIEVWKFLKQFSK